MVQCKNTIVAYFIMFFRKGKQNIEESGIFNKNLLTVCNDGAIMNI